MCKPLNPPASPSSQSNDADSLPSLTPISDIRLCESGESTSSSSFLSLNRDKGGANKEATCEQRVCGGVWCHTPPASNMNKVNEKQVINSQ